MKIVDQAEHVDVNVKRGVAVADITNKCQALIMPHRTLYKTVTSCALYRGGHKEKSNAFVMTSRLSHPFPR